MCVCVRVCVLRTWMIITGAEKKLASSTLCQENVAAANRQRRHAWAGAAGVVRWGRRWKRRTDAIDRAIVDARHGQNHCRVR
jgi:hypothetical protein